jgi:ABC-type Mn2+/Zn2+ transport system permease subunit
MNPTDILGTLVREFPSAMLGSMAVGAACGYLGVYILARRVVFFGAVLTQVSVLGLALTFLPFIAIPHTVGSLVLTLAFALLLPRTLRGSRLPADTVLGIVFVTAIAVRILILQHTPKVEVSEIENLLRGDILFVTADLVYPTVITTALAIAVLLALFKEFRYVTFDAETARTQGYRAGLWDTLFYGIAGAVIALSTHLVGDIFVFGFIVIPPAAAMLLSQRVSRILLLAVLIGGIAPFAGLFLAFLLDLPASPTSVAVAGVVLLAAALGTALRR